MKSATFLHEIVRQLRRRTDARPAAPDAELLERFRATGDPVAFEAIVRRHGACVLSVCRKLLSSPADVDDAFQATFIALWRSAGSVRKREALGGWLCGVAHRVALTALREAARRQRAERQQQLPAAGEPDLSWREACAILHEELDRLPDQYRLPLILCYLEGKSRDEAAQHLGVRLDVVRGRLARGRGVLRGRLTKRGVALSAGLLAAVAGSAAAGGPAGMVSGRLLGATLDAATRGHLPGNVAALLRGAAAPVRLGKFKLLALAAITAGLVTAGVGLSMLDKPPAPAPRPASAPPAPVAAPADKAEEGEKEVVELKGRVLGPDGRPATGARVLVVPFTGKTDGFAPVPAPAPTGDDGRFQFKVPRSKVRHARYDIPVPALIATAPGFYPGWGGTAGEATLRLAKEDVKVTGRVVNLEGKPVAKATVRVTGVLAPEAGTLGPWLAALKARRKDGALRLEQDFLPAEIPADVLPGVTDAATTDADGRFELAGYGKDRVLKAVVSGPGIAACEVRFVTRDFEPVRLPTYGRDDMPGATPYYGPGGTHPAAPDRPITGTVRDRATNKPVAGVVIKSITMAPHARIGDQFLTETKTDADGRFTLLGMPKGEGNSILAVPDEKQPYAAAVRKVPDAPGFDPVPVRIDLIRGVWIEGTVTDKRTGKTLRQVEVEYYPDVANEAVKAVPGGDESYYAKERFCPTLTGADGKFCVLGLPGKGFVAAVGAGDRYVGAGDRYLAAADRSGEGGSDRDSLPTLPHIVSARGYHAVYEVDVPADAAPFRRPVTFDSGLRFKARVVGPDGKPVAGAESFGVGRGGWSAEAEPGQHRIDSYNPRRPRTVLFVHAEKNLVGVLTVAEDFAADTHTLTLRPGATATGRVVDADGRPRGGVRIRLAFQPKKDGAWSSYVGEEEKHVTDAGGRFRRAGLAPGFRYAIVVDGVHSHSFTIDPEAAGPTDLGDLRFDPREN
jgi:RNA polymerase sigma factor (sigma-70 family)